MTLDRQRARQFLTRADLTGLFVEELGWDRHTSVLAVMLGGTTTTLHAVAQKRGMVAYHCPTRSGGRLPDHAQRMRIEHQVAKSALEHLIVFTDPSKETQIWQWVKREPGKPAACREHTFHRSQPGDGLLQKLEAIAFTLAEEERLSLPDVTLRTRSGFDVESVTRRFYEQFQKEHTAFLDFIKGITERAHHEWYASVMLNRLMFVYFIQRKGFLDGDRDYLRNRLERMRTDHGTDKFYSFYRYFLLRLFHEGLGGRKRSAELERIVGRIPYLNGGLFDVHELERPDRYGEAIEIPDDAFARIFDYFDQYQWHLDERPLRADNEINPDVLGYIFEKYINQKQMGAYYTKEDITEYIAKNTVLPCLFDVARAECKVAFENPKGPTVWDLLKTDPERYIQDAIRYGLGTALPAEGVHDASASALIEPPCSAPDAALAPPLAHPTETWRETAARRAYCKALVQRLAAGEVHDINELITLNLDIRQFAQDVIEHCEGPDLLRALWHAIESVSILDPTCGSGAFLFAALTILEPLYEACLDRMEVFLEDLARSGEKHRPEKFSDFRRILDRVAAHPNRRYFVFKSIILNNLFGVDIMEEAVEICKLRLFLKLAAQVDPDADRENFGIEPLPDVDFNIRAGNTLVGFTSLASVLKHAEGDWVRQQELAGVRVTAEDLQQRFDAFRLRQVEGDGSVPTEDKQDLRRRLHRLGEELNTYLAGEYDVDSSKKTHYAKWLASHQPFHWFVEFHRTLTSGGFDVIIGNPPYVNAAKVRKSYTVQRMETERCPDIYAWVLERSASLLKDTGRTGMILPLSLTFSADFDSLRRLLLRTYRGNWFSSFGRIPAALFSFDVRVRNTIHLGTKSAACEFAHTTRLHRWYEIARPILFEALTYAPFTPSLWKHRIPKLNTAPLARAFERLLASHGHTLDRILATRPTSHVLHFKKTAYNWLTFCRVLPPCYEGNKAVAHTKFGDLYLHDAETMQLALLLTNGKLMFVYWLVVADDFDVTKWNFGDFPTDFSTLDAASRARAVSIAPELERAMQSAVQFKLNAGRRVGTYNLAKCREITDKSDRILSDALGLTDALCDIELYYAQTVRTDFGTDSEGE